jgi:hypothetical protein
MAVIGPVFTGAYLSRLRRRRAAELGRSHEQPVTGNGTPTGTLSVSHGGVGRLVPKGPRRGPPARATRGSATDTRLLWLRCDTGDVLERRTSDSRTLGAAAVERLARGETRAGRGMARIVGRRPGDHDHLARPTAVPVAAARPPATSSQRSRSWRVERPAASTSATEPVVPTRSLVAAVQRMSRGQF